MWTPLNFYSLSNYCLLLKCYWRCVITCWEKINNWRPQIGRYIGNFCNSAFCVKHAFLMNFGKRVCQTFLKNDASALNSFFSSKGVVTSVIHSFLSNFDKCETFSRKILCILLKLHSNFSKLANIGNTTDQINVTLQHYNIRNRLTP